MNDAVHDAVHDEAVFDLLRSTLTDLAAEARPVDLAPRAVRRVRQRVRAVSIVSAVAAVLIGLPIGALAAAAGSGGGHSTPTTSPSLSIGSAAPPR